MVTLEHLRSELLNLQDLMRSRPTEDWAREIERVDELKRILAEADNA